MRKRRVRFFAAARAAAAALLFSLAGGSPAFAAEGEKPQLLKGAWSFDGPFGRFDRASLRRGLQIYREVCSSCHGLSFLYLRNLSEAGGPELSLDAVKAIAADYEITDGPDREGDMFQRKRRPSDRFPEPYDNDQAARVANAGALPPDLSLIIKAREGGADYVYSLLQGYEAAPAGVKLDETQHFNKYFHLTGGVLAMPPPLTDGIVDYEGEGAPKATVKQMAHDVTAFLAWASEPRLEERKRLGFQVMVYLAIFAALLYFSTRRLWLTAHGEADEKEESA